MRIFLRAASALCLAAHAAHAIDLDLADAASVKSAASTIAYGLMKYYTGNNTGDVPGNLPDPYYWWETGALFGTLVDYWYLTGDATYNNVTSQALLHQAGNNRDFMPPNQTRTEGNDDQGFWALAALSAAENNFPNPPADQPQWLALAQAVFNQFVSRWDTQTCGGGLRWQIFTFNQGFNYKNAISNGCFFNVAARLARFTGNRTYAAWAEKVWDWQADVGLTTGLYDIYDGASVAGGNNCSAKDRTQWSYNHAIFLHGAAVMYNITSSAANAANASNLAPASLWKTRVDGLLSSTQTLFFNNSVMVEQACENSTISLCDTDQRSFKGYLARWLAGTTQMAPYTTEAIAPLLDASALAAARSCTGSPTGPGTAATGPPFKGIPGTACGFRWTAGGWDGSAGGVGEQMNALSAVMYTLVPRRASAGAATGPVTASSGGTSTGDPNAGVQNGTGTAAEAAASVAAQYPPIGTRDRVAAGLLTTGMVLSVLAGGIVMVK